jgi:hypothetical protein
MNEQKGMINGMEYVLFLDNETILCGMIDGVGFSFGDYQHQIKFTRKGSYNKKRHNAVLELLKGETK